MDARELSSMRARVISYPKQMLHSCADNGVILSRADYISIPLKHNLSACTKRAFLCADCSLGLQQLNISIRGPWLKIITPVLFADEYGMSC